MEKSGVSFVTPGFRFRQQQQKCIKLKSAVVTRQWYNKIEVHIKSSTLLVNEKFFKTTYMLCNHTVSTINFVFHTEHMQDVKRAFNLY